MRFLALLAFGLLVACSQTPRPLDPLQLDDQGQSALTAGAQALNCAPARLEIRRVHEVVVRTCRRSQSQPRDPEGARPQHGDGDIIADIASEVCLEWHEETIELAPDASRYEVRGCDNSVEVHCNICGGWTTCDARALEMECATPWRG